MRSRYAAFALNLPEYIARSWHSSTRPLLDQLRASGSDASHWIGLKIKRHTIIDADHAQVEFTARYKIASRAYVLQETSNFVRENDHWFYVDGRIES
ncbi:MAG: motif protein [Verrucomicrobiaceae bacterium]|nr:motif protein [Verrucomicrobiaceae bacterium]